MAFFLFVLLVIILAAPISEGHRNAQTATLTAGMLENGTLRLDPIAPWRGDLDARLTLELPIYNFTTLGLHSALPFLTLDTAGRLASLLFWVAAFLLLQPLWKRTLPPPAIFWANLLFLLCPMNLYLATAFMPETLLLLLTIAFLLIIWDYAHAPSLTKFAALTAISALALPFLAAILFFAIFTLRDLPASLPLLALQLLNLAGAWTGLMLATAASDAPEEPYAPSKKLLNLSPFLGSLAAISSFLALPMAKITMPAVFLPAAVALTSLSWLAPLALLLTLLTALVYQHKKT